jgi:iron complex transport system substrate-binding protein
MSQRVEKVVKGLPAASKRAVILHSIGNSVTVQMENSIAGDVARMIGLNIFLWNYFY